MRRLLLRRQELPLLRFIRGYVWGCGGDEGGCWTAGAGIERECGCGCVGIKFVGSTFVVL